jgi:hypothetical protein
VESDLALLVQEAEVHGAGMQVDATIKLVLLSIESHEVSSSPEVVFPSPSSPTWYAEEGASISIKGIQATATVFVGKIAFAFSIRSS